MLYARQAYDGVNHPIPRFTNTMVHSRLKQIEHKDKGVIRLHPTQLSFLTYSSKMIEFSRLQFSQYDEIYFTARKNIPDMISSLFIATTTGKFTYTHKQEVRLIINPLTLNPDLYFQSVEMLLYSELMMNSIKEYLTSNSIEWKELDHDNIPKHIVDNYSNATTAHVETEYDYRSIVTNYNELQTIYDQLKPIVLQRFLADNEVDK